MTAPGAKNGPLTAADIQAIWTGAVDKGYSDPLIAAGEGNGFEAWTQMFQTFARLSQAVDISTQAMYILPSSGMSNPPASRAGFAQVKLTVSRGTAYVQWALVFKAGQILVGEQTTDWGVNPGDDGVTVQTGREYMLLEDLVLPPGDLGPYDVLAQAVAPGYGYNNPLPGTIQLINQPGDEYTNVEASMEVFLTTPPAIGVQPIKAILVAANIPDMFLPSQLGQYVALTQGANAGSIARIKGYVAPVPPLQGSGVILAYDQAVECAISVGEFQPGEQILFDTGASLTSVGLFVGQQPGGTGTRIVFELLSGAGPSVGDTLTGNNSGATATVDLVLQNLGFSPEFETASWRILDWLDELQVQVTNKLSPAGGLSAMLDELGSERAIPAGTNEDANTYRRRVAQVADTVSPNAIRRVLGKALGQLPWCFREVGTPVYLPGIYFDIDPNATSVNPGGADYYDTNCLVFAVVFGPLAFIPGEELLWTDANGFIIGRGTYGGVIPSSTQQVFVIKGTRDPSRLVIEAGDEMQGVQSNERSALTTLVVPGCKEGLREHVWFDYLRMRGYFQVGVSPSDDGEFGFFYDTFPLSHLGGFYDENVTGRNFYDGFPAAAYARWRVLWQDVERVREGGTVWDLYLETVGCP